jgi:hypothetical protein
MIDAAGAKAVGNVDKTEALAHPQHQLFREAADVHHHQALRRGRELDGEVAVAHGVQAVLAQRRLAMLVHHAQGPRHDAARSSG